MKIALIGSSLMTGLNKFFTASGAPVEVLEMDSDELVQKIHDEFDNSLAEREAAITALLGELKIPVESEMATKAKRLIAAGFVNSQVVAKSKEEDKIAKMTAKQRADYEAELGRFRYYQGQYPLSKFITFDELKRICKKYNLVYTEVNRYLRDVPEKNLREIEKCQQLRNDHTAKDELWIKVTKYSKELEKKFKNQWVKLTGNYDAKEIKKGNRSYLSSFVSNVYNVEQFETKEIKKTGLFICAPASHFDLKGLKSDGDFGYARYSTVDVKDPIVFEFLDNDNICRIITKWGKESEDEALVNPVEN